MTRIYSEADFGVFALFMSVISILSILATGKYEEAVLLTKEKKETDALVGFLLKWIAGFSLLIFILLIFLKEEIFSLFNMQSLSGYWYFIPLTVFFTGLSYLLIDLATKKKKFKTIASSGLNMNGTSSLIKLGLGYFPIVRGGLIISVLIGQLAACISFFRYGKDLLWGLRSNRKHQWKTGIKYKEFPLYSMTRNLVNSFSGNIPFLLLTGIFGEAALGVFSMALMMGSRPSALISGSLYQVFFEKTVSLKNERKPLFPVLKSYWKKTTLYLLPICILAFFLSPWLFGFVFGQKWEISGVYFQYLLPWIFLTFIIHPMFFIPALFGKQRKALGLEILCLILRWIGVMISIYFNNFESAVILYSLAGVIYSVIVWIWYISMIKKYEKTIVL